MSDEAKEDAEELRWERPANAAASEAPQPCPARQARKGARAAAAEDDPEQWRADIDGWHRFRGQGKRGTPPADTVDGADLAMAMRDLAAGREELLAAHAMPRGRERRAAMAAAVGKLALVSRFVDAVVERRGGTPADCEMR